MARSVTKKQQVGEFVIEKGIPLREVSDYRKYPFAKMDVGDSFYVGKIDHNIRTAAAAYGKAHNKKFTCFREGNGMRVGRVK